MRTANTIKLLDCEQNIQAVWEMSQLSTLMV